MLNQKLAGKEIILASQSPRRNELLKGLDINFKVVVKSVEETYPINTPTEKIAEYIAVKKASAFADIGDNQIIITADTVVLLNDQALGKPKDKEEAFSMIQSLSGKTHKVITGVCLKTNEKEVPFSVSTKVYFKELSSEEINYYIDKYEPYDKAGSYGIQEWIGYIGIQKIEGSYYNVMGLPLYELNDHLLSL